MSQGITQNISAKNLNPPKFRWDRIDFYGLLFHQEWKLKFKFVTRNSPNNSTKNFIVRVGGWMDIDQKGT